MMYPNHGMENSTVAKRGKYSSTSENTVKNGEITEEWNRERMHEDGILNGNYTKEWQ